MAVTVRLQTEVEQRPPAGTLDLDVPQSGRFRARLEEIDMFFQGSDGVHQTMRHVAGRLGEAKIVYAIVGGMAVNVHHPERTGDLWLVRERSLHDHVFARVTERKSRRATAKAAEKTRRKSG